MSSPYTTGLPVTTHRMLFLDDTHIESVRDVRRNFHQLRRTSNEPLIVPDRPTDQINVTIHGTVLRDTRDGTLHMWYHSQRFTKEGHVSRICYARSGDGITWEKPDVGTVEIEGSTRHNVVAQSEPTGYAPGINVIHCPDEPDEKRRFRRIYQRPAGTFVAYSPDGIRWDETDEFAFHCSHVGHGSCVFYDMLGKRFIATTIQEPPVGRFPRRRTPALATSDDFRNWSDFHIAFQCDNLDDKLVVERLEKRRAVLSYGIPDHFHEEVNTMFCFNYADMILGLPVMFDCCGYDEWKGTPGGTGSGKDDAVSHVQLAWCPDPVLRDWQRPWREPFLPISEPPRWGSGFLNFAEAPVRVGDELWFFYSGLDHSQQHPVYTLNHGWKFKQGELQGGISAAALRLDGFASLDADRQGGEVTTRALPFNGERILVNAVSYHGLAVEILDETGNVIPGFGLDDCVPIKGDSVCHALRFKDANVSQLTGKRIQVRIAMSGTMLFAIVFE